MIPCHGPIGFAVGEAKEVMSLQILVDHGRFNIFDCLIFLSVKSFHS